MTRLEKEIDDIINTLMFPTRFSKSFTNQGTTYPPYNIIKGSDTETILEIAVAGFKEDEITVVVEDGHLKISGKKETNDTVEYLYKGIGARAFEKTFALSKDSIVNGADYIDGILRILVEYKVPDEKKSRSIPIYRPDRTLLTE